MVTSLHKPDYVEAYRLDGNKPEDPPQWVVRFSDDSIGLEQVTVFLTETQLFALDQVIRTASSAPNERICATIDPSELCGFKLVSKDV